MYSSTGWAPYSINVGTKNLSTTPPNYKEEPLHLKRKRWASSYWLNRDLTDSDHKITTVTIAVLTTATVTWLMTTKATVITTIVKWQPMKPWLATSYSYRQGKQSSISQSGTAEPTRNSGYTTRNTTKPLSRRLVLTKKAQLKTTWSESTNTTSPSCTPHWLRVKRR